MASAEMPRLDAAERRLPDAEDPADPAQEFLFAGVVAPVGHRDLEQPFEDVLEDLRPVREHPPNAAGIDVEAGDVLPRQVEDPCCGLLVLRRDPEHLPERRDFRGLHLSVRLGHLRPEPHDRDREGDRGLRRAAAAVEHGRQRLPAGDEGGDRVGDAGPDRHGTDPSSPALAAQQSIAPEP